MMMHQRLKAQRNLLLLAFLFVSCPTRAWLSPFATRQRCAQRNVLLNAQRKFQQPAFSNDDSSNHHRQPRSDSQLSEFHNQRIRTAGRVGTKRFVNPCKVFIGNLPFNVTEQALSDWVCQQMGLPAAILLSQVKIVHDWKTGKSKGYGFCVFTEPIYATVCIDKCHFTDCFGRKVTVNQGQKKQPQPRVYVKKKNKPARTAEEAVIQQGISQAQQEAEDEEPLDPEEYALLKRLDADLLPVPRSNNVDNDDLLDDETSQVDGFWDGGEQEEDDNARPTTNREKRREAARRQKRRRLPSKGFGDA